ncbi:phosphotransferase family protein [Paenibacillus solani]|uniref:Phosphotransferase n=1 Tax=Paenibacillus solani TaxID=1705565 RepID=A0A0M1P723_9BACL|nr:aminoglycoside phosphotransferase family protein [Paenibacillus solani]KOR90283.1 phosphotransferase [Paenibacillus solani]
MTTKIFFSANGIGAITNLQVQAVLDRFNLGSLIGVRETSHGVGKQTIFVSSDLGEYVLKGNPLYEGQFLEEKFNVESLNKLTSLPVATPYIVDERHDIFGWNYAIMPKLPGKHINDQNLTNKINKEEEKQIAKLLANTLCELHQWKVEHFGEFDPTTQCIRPFNGTYKTWLYDRIKYWLEDAKKYSVITCKDIEWVEKLLWMSEEAFNALSSPTFVMGDFKADNVLVQRSAEDWILSGIFDFTTGYFGDSVADLPRIVTMYIDEEEEELARLFIREYFNHCEHKENFIARYKVHMLHQRVMDWGCAKATGDVTWDESLSFTEWAEKYTEFEFLVK